MTKIEMFPLEQMNLDPVRWPILAHAKKEIKLTVKVEWLVEERKAPCAFCGTPDVMTNLRHEFNYMQIFHTPVINETRSEAFERHLDEVESCLRYGVRQHTKSYRKMAGAWSLLGERQPRVTDDLTIVFLRQTQFLSEHSLDGRDEWLTECTIKAIPGV